MILGYLGEPSVIPGDLRSEVREKQDRASIRGRSGRSEAQEGLLPTVSGFADGGRPVAEECGRYPRSWDWPSAGSQPRDGALVLQLPGTGFCQQPEQQPDSPQVPRRNAALPMP